MKNKTPKKMFSLALALFMALALLPTTAMAEATDYDNHWSAQYIDQCREHGWMAGDGQGNFRPDDSITRGEFAVMLWRALGSSAPQGDCPVTDIAADAWYRNAVTALHEAGVVTGYGNGLYGPNDTLTREMAFVMLARAFDLKPVSAGEAAEYTTFADYADVSSWATDAASVLVLKEYVSGVSGNLLMPKKALTRGEMAKLLIIVYGGENEPAGPPSADTSPVITLMQSPTTSTYGNVKISVSVESTNDIAYIGWRSSSNGASYTDKTGFTDVTAAKEFSISSNGWYAVCAVDTLGNFNFKLIQITNIRTSSGGGSSGGGSTTYYTVTYDANGETGGQHAVTGVSGSHTVLDDTDTGFSAVGKTFVGWNTLADGGGIFYTSGASLAVTADTTLYAMWSGDPFLVYDAETLAAIGTDAGGYAGWTLSADYKVVADISLTAAWTPIGDGSAPFTGNLDGNGHTIDGLTINDNTAEFAGLFGLIVDGSVSDLTLTNAAVNVAGSGAVYAGVIAGVNDGGRIGGCDVTGVVVAESAGGSPAAGGLVGYNLGVIEDSISDVGVSAEFTSAVNAEKYAFAGGLAGINAGGVTGSHAGGDVYASNASTNSFSVALAGGLAGYASGGSITDSSAACGVSADAYNAAYIGGIAGQNDADIFRCSFSGELAAEATDGAVEMGGIAGDNWWQGSDGGVIENCYTTGSMTGNALNVVWTGGIAGFNGGKVFYCYAAMEIDAAADPASGDVYAGGIAGSNGTVSHCAALGGSISASGDAVYAKRITGGGSSLVTTNNYANGAMAINSGTSYMPVSDINGADGADAAAADYSDEAWWRNVSAIGWAFGSSDAEPWKWNSARNLPILYWQ